MRPRILIRMCGIAGFAGRDRLLLDRMLASIVHRGPDGEGVDVGPHFSIGMRRLAIIDVGGGQQPRCKAVKHLVGAVILAAGQTQHGKPGHNAARERDRRAEGR